MKKPLILVLAILCAFTAAYVLYPLLNPALPRLPKSLTQPVISPNGKHAVVCKTGSPSLGSLGDFDKPTAYWLSHCTAADFEAFTDPEYEYALEALTNVTIPIAIDDYGHQQVVWREDSDGYFLYTGDQRIYYVKVKESDIMKSIDQKRGSMVSSGNEYIGTFDLKRANKLFQIDQ